MAKKYSGNLMTSLAKSLIEGQGDPRLVAAQNARIKPILGDKDGEQFFAGYDWGNIDPTSAQMARVEADAEKIAALQNIDDGVSLPQLGGLAVQSARLHPFKTMALAGSAFGNIGGLTDNDKFGGQLAGLGLGGLGANLAGDVLGPYGKIMLTMGGGNLGALFDKLRARKEAEQAQQAQFMR